MKNILSEIWGEETNKIRMYHIEGMYNRRLAEAFEREEAIRKAKEEKQKERDKKKRK